MIKTLVNRFVQLIQKVTGSLMKHILFMILFTGILMFSEKSEALPVSVPDSTAIWDSLITANKVKNNPLALSYARRNMLRATRLNTEKAYLNAYMKLGEVFSRSSKDSAFIYYSKAVKLANNKDFENERVTIFLNLALLYKSAQDLKTSILYLDSTIILTEKTGNYSVMADAYNVLGNIKADIQDTENAWAMYDSSFVIAQKHSLNRQMGVALGNLAKFEPNVKLSLKKQREAISYLSKEKGTYNEVATILINIGNRYISNPDSALSYFKKALDLGLKDNLSEILLGAYNNMAYSYLDKSDIVNAEQSIKLAISLAEKAKNHDWLSTLYDTYADILSTKGDFENSVLWQKKALSERVAADRNQSAGQLRLLAALLDTKSKEILLQNKENELLTQSNRLQTTRLWLVVSVILIIVVSFFFYWYQQRSRMRLKNQQVESAKRIIEMDESEKGRIARELHDITGQLVMGITSEIENLEIPSDKVKDEIQEKIKGLGKSIRQISHRMNRAMIEHFSFEELLTGQCEDMQRLTGIPIFLTLPETKTELSRDSIIHIHRIFQELLTNASKYAKNGEVYITVSRNAAVLIISYSDTGPGFDNVNGIKGMGLMNINERAKLLGGSAVLETSPGNGLNWEITIPVNSQPVFV